jgi:hypothetical protein
MKPTILNIKNIAEAETELNKIKVHPVGVKIMALKAVYCIVKFEDVDPKAANIIKQEMFSRGGDVAVAETVGKFENKKTDILIMGTLAQYVRLVRKLRMQSYGDCLKIAQDLADLLFKDFDLSNLSVW